jgi:hypothetical protein
MQRQTSLRLGRPGLFKAKAMDMQVRECVPKMAALDGQEGAPEVAKGKEVSTAPCRASGRVAWRRRLLRVDERGGPT